jgi:hypothetical protein
MVLEVEFLNGGIYQYKDVPKSVHGDLMAADSHGAYFNKNIKDKYTWVKVEHDMGPWIVAEQEAEGYDPEPLSECCGEVFDEMDGDRGVCSLCRKWAGVQEDREDGKDCEANSAPQKPFKRTIKPLEEKAEGSKITFDTPTTPNKGRSGSGHAIIAIVAFVALNALYRALRG